MTPVFNKIGECGGYSVKRMDLRNMRYLIVHRVSFARAEVGGLPPVADDDLTGPSMAARQISLPTIGRCAYHFLIRRNGEIDQCLPLTRRGAHALKYNPQSCAVALAGDFTRDPPTFEQFRSAVELCAVLASLNHGQQIAGHTSLPDASSDPSKVCPGEYLSVPSLVVQADAIMPADWRAWTKEHVEWTIEQAGIVI